MRIVFRNAKGAFTACNRSLSRPCTSTQLAPGLCSGAISFSRRDYHPPGYDHKGKKKDTGVRKVVTEEDGTESHPNAEEVLHQTGGEASDSGVNSRTRPSFGGGKAMVGGSGGGGGLVSVGKGVAAGTWGRSQEVQRYELPADWKNIVSTLCLRTNFEPAELADLFQTFRQLAGQKQFLTAEEFRQTVRRNFGIMKEEWVQRYFQAFDRNHSGTIDFQEYVMGFAGMARVLTDKKASSLIGLSTGTNIVRSGRSARLFWDGPPRRVAIVKKWKDAEVAKKTEALVAWLQGQEGLTVLVDPSEDDIVNSEGKPVFMPHVLRFDPHNLANQTDFIICLGGDGTVLKAAQYFDDSTPIPPTLAFGLGSLGFLAPFNPEDSQSMISRVLNAYRKPISVTLRTRLRGEVYSRKGQLERVFYSLNEFIVNRGISGVLSTLEVFVDGQLVTTAQGDGLIVASPSGSTAYNISAGGCMVSPLVPATLITPIAPHSLSFRPILTSASSEITVRIPDNARADGWMSHDATEAVGMKKGSYVKLSTATIPLPTVNQRELDGDWFQSIRDKLNWNVRNMQKPLDSTVQASSFGKSSKVTPFIRDGGYGEGLDVRDSTASSSNGQFPPPDAAKGSPI